MDVQAYLYRINYTGPIEANIDTLRGLHRAHLLAVPFENLDIPLGRPIVLDEQQLFEKIIRSRRGGFCYELNGLFAALLREMRFNVQRLAARVPNEQGGYGIPFDHMTLLVHLERKWLADVGFGESFREPLSYNDRGVQEQAHGRYRLSDEDGSLIYCSEEEGAWKLEYIFDTQPHELAAFNEGCRYHQSSPRSSFTHRRVCSLATPEGRITLSDMKLITTTNGIREERSLNSEDEYNLILREQFGIDIQGE